MACPDCHCGRLSTRRDDPSGDPIPLPRADARQDPFFLWEVELELSADTDFSELDEFSIRVY